MALEVGIWFLVNVGYGGPIEDDATRPAVRGITTTQRHIWPPVSLTTETRRAAVARSVLGAADGAGADPEALLGFLMGLAAREDDTIFVANAPDIGPIQSAGICLEPAIFKDDPLSEVQGPIRPGDFCAFILRGQPVPLLKVFAGIIDRGFGPTALFYLSNPEGVIEADIDDVLWVSRIAPPRALDGNALLAAADPFVGGLLAAKGVPGDLEPTGMTRQTAWVESMLAVLGVLRGQPE